MLQIQQQSFHGLKIGVEAPQGKRPTPHEIERAIRDYLDPPSNLSIPDVCSRIKNRIGNLVELHFNALTGVWTVNQIFLLVKSKAS